MTTTEPASIAALIGKAVTDHVSQHGVRTEPIGQAVLAALRAAGYELTKLRAPDAFDDGVACWDAAGTQVRADVYHHGTYPCVTIHGEGGQQMDYPAGIAEQLLVPAVLAAAIDAQQRSEARRSS